MTDAPDVVPETKPRMSRFALVWFGFFVGIPLLFLGGCLAMVVFVDPNAADDRPPLQAAIEDSAARQCRLAVKDKLKSPATAKFLQREGRGRRPDRNIHRVGLCGCREQFRRVGPFGLLV